jgi:alpha-tubulin suppressor-like RCC1 family protein
MLRLLAQVACGARHTVFHTSCKKAYSTGWGKYGQLGLGDTSSRNVPEHIVLDVAQDVRDIACGWWSTILLAE